MNLFFSFDQSHNKHDSNKIIFLCDDYALCVFNHHHPVNAILFLISVSLLSHNSKPVWIPSAGALNEKKMVKLDFEMVCCQHALCTTAIQRSMFQNFYEMSKSKRGKNEKLW